jgi:hypothetical protein
MPSQLSFNVHLQPSSLQLDWKGRRPDSLIRSCKTEEKNGQGNCQLETHNCRLCRYSLAHVRSAPRLVSSPRADRPNAWLLPSRSSLYRFEERFKLSIMMASRSAARPSQPLPLFVSFSFSMIYSARHRLRLVVTIQYGFASPLYTHLGVQRVPDQTVSLLYARP